MDRGFCTEANGFGLFNRILVVPSGLLSRKLIDAKQRKGLPGFLRTVWHEIRRYINCECHTRAATQGSLMRTSEKWTQGCRRWRNEALKWCAERKRRLSFSSLSETRTLSFNLKTQAPYPSHLQPSSLHESSQIVLPCWRGQPAPLFLKFKIFLYIKQYLTLFELRPLYVTWDELVLVHQLPVIYIGIYNDTSLHTVVQCETISCNEVWWVTKSIKNI